MGFMGEHQHSIDGKGRLIVPSKFREGLGEKFVVTKGLDGCLFVFPAARWSVLEEQLAKLPLTDSSSRIFTRFLLSGATECEVDKQGRILIPSNLREYSKLDRDVVLIGMGDRVEIWSSEVWEKYGEGTDKVELVAQGLASLDFRI